MTSVVFVWFLCVLAVYRLAHLFTLEDGPVRIFARVRERIIKRWGFESWQAEGARCPLCQSVWYAFLAAYFLHPATAQDYVLCWLSIAGAVLILHRLIYR